MAVRRELTVRIPMIGMPYRFRNEANVVRRVVPGHRMQDCRAGMKTEEKAKARPQPKPPNNPKGSPEVPQPPPPPGRAAELKSMLADAASILR